MEKLLLNNTPHLLLTLVLVFAVVSLLAFVIKTINEKNQELEEIRNEVSSLRKGIIDNNNRTNIAVNNLQKKLEENKRNNQQNISVFEKLLNNQNLVGEEKPNLIDLTPPDESATLVQESLANLMQGK